MYVLTDYDSHNQEKDDDVYENNLSWDMLAGQHFPPHSMHMVDKVINQQQSEW